MSVKRFVAADMRRALELVRQEMGPEAIILSSRRIKQGVEILTSLEAEPLSRRTEADVTVAEVDVPMGSDGAWRDQALVEQALSNHSALLGGRSAQTPAPRVQATAAQPSERGPASGKTPSELADEMERAREKMIAARNHSAINKTKTLSTTGGAPSDEVEPSAVTALNAEEKKSLAPQQSNKPPAQRSEQQAQLDALQSELADMRLLLEEQLTRMAQTPHLGSPTHSGLMRRFKHMGFTDAIAQRVVSSVSHSNTVQEAWADAQGRLSQQLPTLSEDPVMSGGVYAFVGPTGVGKTTTIAKLAARYVLEHGAENVALVTTDTYRIAAHDQLRSLGRILNVQVKVVDDNRDLPHVLRSLKGCPLVLIDTAGFRQGDNQLKEQLDVIAAIEEVKTFLVMASNSQLQMLKASVHSHISAGLFGCVLTKVDETASLGEALSVIMEHGLKVCYTTNGQEIPQDITVAKSHQLVSGAVSLMKSGMNSLAHFSSSSIS